MRKIDVFAMVLVLIGAINWGLVGLFEVDIIDVFFERLWVDRLIYMLIGAAGFFKIVYFVTGKWKIEFKDNDD